MSPPFTISVLFDIAALGALVPSALMPLRPRPTTDRVFWAAQGVAVAGALLLVLWRVGTAWDASLATALWLSIAATLIVYMAFGLARRSSVGLLPLLGPYLLLLGLIGTALDLLAPSAGPAPDFVSVSGEGAWIAVHVIVSLATYALATIAAVAGVAVMIREAALKTKREGPFVALLPALGQAESLQFRALVLATLVLGLGIVSGMAVEVLIHGQLLEINHKTVLSFLALAALIALLLAHGKAGLRGRRAARIVLGAYLFLTLAYPGVKAVQQIML